MHGFYVTSVGPRVSALDMFSFMCSAKFEFWKGTTEYFILNCQDQVRLYESLVDADSCFSENQKKKLLENVVDLVKSLRPVTD